MLYVWGLKRVICTLGRFECLVCPEFMGRQFGVIGVS
jgi:hypothetical protein